MPLTTHAALARLASHQHELFTTAEAHGLSVTEAQLYRLAKSGVVERLYQGVYRFTSSVPTPVMWIAAAVMAGGPECFAAGRSAALLLDLPGQSSHFVEVAAPKGLRPQRGTPLLIVHESKRVLSGDIRLADGIRVARVERVIVDLAAALGPRRCEEAFHAARRKRLTTHESMAAYLERYARRGRNGCGIVRAMLDQHLAQSAPTESVLEDRVLSVIRAAGLPEPERQVVVSDLQQRFVGRADFGHPDLRIVVLAHSRTWHATPEDVERDESQRNRYWSAGWIPIIARTDDIYNGGPEFLAAFRAARSMRRQHPAA